MTIEKINNKLVETIRVRMGEYIHYQINTKSTYEFHYSLYIDEEINEKNPRRYIYTTSYEMVIKAIKDLKAKKHKILLEKAFINKKGYIEYMFYNIH